MRPLDANRLLDSDENVTI